MGITPKVIAIPKGINHYSGMIPISRQREATLILWLWKK